MVLSVKGSGTGGSVRLYVRKLLSSGGSGGATLWIGDMVDVSIH